MKEISMKDGFFKYLYYWLVRGEKSIGHLLLLVIRLYWGGLLILVGVGQFASVQSVADFLTSLHIPFPLVMAYLVSILEIVGGTSLFLGLFARLFAPLLILLFGVAYATAYYDAVANIFYEPSGFISQEPFLYLYSALLILCFGAGCFSFDAWIEKKAYGRVL